MKTGLDAILDAMLLLMMLAAGLPVLLFCFNVLLNEQDYGFDTFKEKSVQERAFNPTDYWGETIEDKAIWTDAHRALMNLVDDRVPDDKKLDRQSLLNSGYNQAIAGMGGLSWNSGNRRYHITWGVNRTINIAVFNNAGWVRPPGSPAIPNGTGFYTSKKVSGGVGWKSVDE